jgi:putative DNA primase/helicase
VAPGTIAEAYLRNRVPGIDAVPKCLRAHAGLDYMERTAEGQYQRLGRYPALLAAAQGLDGRVVNIWRTYLSADGFKAPVKEAKKACGRFLQPSYAVRLAEPDDELGIAEGVETALAAMVLYGVPCWSTLNADGMKKFCLPEGYERVRKIRIFGDNDRPDQRGRRAGNEAAEFLKQKMRDSGRVATVILPKYTTFDFANIVQKEAA